LLGFPQGFGAIAELHSMFFPTNSTEIGWHPLTKDYIIQMRNQEYKMFTGGVIFANKAHAYRNLFLECRYLAPLSLSLSLALSLPTLRDAKKLKIQYLAHLLIVESC